ncbi:MAG: hypothetical protein O2931_05420 [Planctomycetota bacterium]|nr:hypothetical protein [Planctomycetota bacterium]MDA1178221.1 hypothetical protein [Planctomycetota bacterium]
MDETKNLIEAQNDLALSVILSTIEGFHTIRHVIECLRQQSVCDRIEVLIVVPDKEILKINESVNDAFAKVTIVEVGPGASLEQARAIGVREAIAPIVLFAEDHAYPEPGWAAAIIRAHEGPWTAVSPAVTNANPDSMLSWADFLLSYGDWYYPGSSREIHGALIHNGSFKRDALLDFGEDLAKQLGRKSTLVNDLTSGGSRLYLESGATVHHANVSKFFPCVGLWLCCGRIFAANRVESEGWSIVRRLVYILMLPVIPVLRLRAGWPAIQNARQFERLFPKIIPGLILVLSA